jgi:hypothetical protein
MGTGSGSGVLGAGRVDSDLFSINYLAKKLGVCQPIGSEFGVSELNRIFAGSGRVTTGSGRVVSSV